MKVIPGMYAHGEGESYQLILSGDVQFNVVWMYGKDFIRVDQSEGGTPFREVRRYPIPSEYRGRPWRDVAVGMRDHIRSVSSCVIRKHDAGYSYEEFRQEWALHDFWVSQKVRYKTVRAGTLLGVVTGTRREGRDRFVLVRVTSRKGRIYKCGEILELSPTDPWLKSREK